MNENLSAEKFGKFDIDTVGTFATLFITRRTKFLIRKRRKKEEMKLLNVSTVYL